MLCLSMKFHQICFSSFEVVAELICYGGMHGRTDGPILRYLRKFFWGHKKGKWGRTRQKHGSVINNLPPQGMVYSAVTFILLHFSQFQVQYMYFSVKARLSAG